jgi:trk system potassium uptake protein TrkH
MRVSGLLSDIAAKYATPGARPRRDAIVALLNNIGPGLNQVGPATTFAVLTDFQIWVLSFTMLVGRLELFTLLILFTPAFWRK